MSTRKNVAVLIGSLRNGSYSRMVAEAIMEIASENLAPRFIEIGDLPHYNEDIETETPPAEWSRIRREIANADALLFVTPEYNRSVPGVLKNALDVISRPYGKNAMSGKPGAIVSISPGALAAFGANHHLRQSLVFLNVPTMQQPEAYIGNVATLFDAAGNLINEGTRSFLQKFAEAFDRWIEMCAVREEPVEQ